MFLNVLKVILIVIEVLIIFNLLIIVHELGHFLAARWRGLAIDGFGIWFGKPIWKKKINGVLYSLGSIPAGGFVKLPQMAPMDAIEGEAEERSEPLKPVSALDKIIVAFAGPLFSMLLAFAMATVVWVIGKPEIEPTTVIGSVLEGGPADLAGLKEGDKIIAIDGKPVNRFVGQLNSVVWNIMRSEGETIDFLVERNGQQIHIRSGWSKEETPGWKRKSLRKVMIGPQITPYVHAVDPGSVAEHAGLKGGDLVVAVNGKPINHLNSYFETVTKAPGEPVQLQVQRENGLVDITLPPAKSPAGDELADDGIVWGKMVLTHPSPLRQVADSVQTMGNMIGGLISSKSDIKVQHFSGPVGIMNLYRRMFQEEDGWRLAIAFSVFFNVNLALLNMLPFPVLDGGHITLAIIESIRRKPVNTRVLEVVQTACAMALIAFMLYVSFFDIGDLFGDRKPADQPAQTQNAK
jgi:regulator of sigma E protease